MMMSRIVLVILTAVTAAAQPAPAVLKVAAVQFRSSFEIGDNCKRIVSILEKLSAQGVQVAAFPECALVGYHKGPVMAVSQEEVSAAEERISRVCRERRIAAVVGSIFKVNGRTYNTAVVFSSRGDLVERYAKLMLAGEKWAAPGNHISFFELEGVPSTVIICHDQRYPELVRLPAIQGARVVYYISHESGMTSERKLEPYRAQMMARAVENNVFVVASNAPGNPKDNSGSHGQSRLILSDGNVLKEASFYNEDVLVDSFEIKSSRSNAPMQGLMAGWWRQGVEEMLKNRKRKLD